MVAADCGKCTVGDNASFWRSASLLGFGVVGVIVVIIIIVLARLRAALASFSVITKGFYDRFVLLILAFVPF